MGILIKLDPEKEHKFRELAMKKFRYKKGALSLALNEAIDSWIANESEFNALHLDSSPPVNYILQKIRLILPDLKKKYSVVQIGVFGSYSRNDQTPASDIDLLVEFDEIPSLLKFIELKNYLSQYLGKNVDLVTKRNLKPEIQKYILEDTIYA